jgi:hypothetical protein
MTDQLVYDIRAFQWNSKTRTFSQDAWNLEWMDDEGDVRAFPSMKEPFIIKNFRTGDKREFVFTVEWSGNWIFWNAEDNITCVIGIDPF